MLTKFLGTTFDDAMQKAFESRLEQWKKSRLIVPPIQRPKARPPHESLHAGMRCKADPFNYIGQRFAEQVRRFIGESTVAKTEEMYDERPAPKFPQRSVTGFPYNQ